MSIEIPPLKVGVINIGFGNVGSCINMLDSIENCEAVIVENYQDFKYTDMLILPGVGSFDTGMKLLKKRELCNPLIDYANEKNLLGICLGMQLITEGSEEGNEEGLGIISGYFKKFPKEDFNSKPLKVPCMGWNFVEYQLDKGFVSHEYEINGVSRYYFVHSYYYAGSEENVCGWSNHGIKYGVVLNNKKTIGVQFHPEKSHDFGRKFLKNWIKKRS